MKTTCKNRITPLATFGVLLIVSQLLYLISLLLEEKLNSSATLLVFLPSISCTIHLSLSATWYSSLKNRIADSYIKKAVLGINLLMASSVLIAICESMFLTDAEIATKGYLQYVSFVPIILIPCVLVILTKRIHLFKTERLVSAPIILIALAIAFLLIRCIFPINYALTVISYFVTLLFIESCIHKGFIPTRVDFKSILNNSTLAVQIVDNDYAPIYISSKGTPISMEIVKSAENSDVRLGNTLLRTTPISAGHVLWLEDITKLNSLIGYLQEAQEQIGEENTLLQAELDLKSMRAQTDEKNRLYDRIAKEVELQLGAIEELLSKADSHPEDINSTMAKVCVLGSYVKRRGNLLLLGEDNNRIQAKELEYCIRESLDNLRLAGVFTAFDSFCEGKILTKHIIAVYDFYEAIVELLLDNINAMMINLICENSTLKLNIQIGCYDDISKQRFEKIAFACGAVDYNIEDQDVIINLLVKDGGDEDA